MKHPVILCTLILAGCSSVSAAAGADMRRYDFYQPAVKHVTIHEGKLAPGHYAYNHMASVEWFDGRFYAVWGAHAETHREGKPGQVNVWARSEDFAQWSPPQRLAHTGPDALPADPQGVQWQPNLLNFHDRQLWCVWSFSSKNAELDGLYLSTLERGRHDWRHRSIQRRQDVNGRPCTIFASQNPVLLSSGRVLVPVTLSRRESQPGGGPATASTVRRWNACFYTDDGGATWRCSNPISSIDDPSGQWEPFFYEQSDGRLRAFMRNFTKGIPAGTQWRLTTVGTGAATGTPVSFPHDPVFSFMETVNCRPQIFRLDGGRYCLLQQDALVNHRDYSTRLNVALHFSRSGADDFVAGTPVSRPEAISAYPQGVAHNGNIHLAYTVGPGDQPRGIEGVLVTPAPRQDRYYVWPRAKELIRMQDVKDASGKKQVVRTNPNARTPLPHLRTVQDRRTIQFTARASAGVDIDPVDFAAGQTLEFRFRANVSRLQLVGTLILCTLGDRLPIRLGMPANRPGKLYAYTRNQWAPVADFALQQWHSLSVVVRGTDFSVTVDGRPPQMFPNPLVNPTPRLYLGEGFDVDYVYSLSGSEFQVDLGSLGTHVR